ERRQAAEARLRELNAGHPTDPARAAEALAELDARLGDRSRTDVAEALEAARETRSRAAAQIEALGRREAELRQVDGPVDAQALGQERASKAARSARLVRFVARATAHLDRRAARLDVAADRTAIQEAVATLRGRWAALREQAERLAALSATRDRLAGEAAARWAEAEAGWGDVAAAWSAAASPSGTHPNGSPLAPLAPPAPWPQWSTTLVDEVWHAAAARIADAYATAGGDAVREVHRAAAAAAAAIGARCDDAAGRWKATVRGLAARLAEATKGDVGPVPKGRGEAIASPSRGVHDPHPSVDMAADPTPSVDMSADPNPSIDMAPDAPPDAPPGPLTAVDPHAPFALDDNPSADALIALQQRLGAHGAADIAVLSERRDRLVRDIDVGQHEQARLATALGLRGEALDVAACGEALADGERTLAVRQHGHRIVDGAARSVVQQVLPSTMDYMRRLLPALTDGRYYDARLSEDYRIETWDERAEAWQKKNLFSGGTKDQFSLALRLAFAMATLPEERGAAPSFLFLDEPLSAFDDQRAGALVQLLTEGEVAESFDQIFLISHVQVDHALFDHRIVLEGGRVVEGFGGDRRSSGDAHNVDMGAGVGVGVGRPV
ncbi:MAG: SbcC/MukB-like Walker B domain-containing protein, partial [Ardenticatenales bacterium]